MMRKYLVLCALLLALPAVSRAQSYDKAHQIAASEFTVRMPSLKRGDKLPESSVMALQYLLRNRGLYKAKVDGKFGFATEKAVRDFQRAKHLKVDGVIGSQTWTPLLLRLKKGDKGDAVRALQILLLGVSTDDGNPIYPNGKVDGVYGAQTVAGVRAFQKQWGQSVKERGFKADGIVGAQTWGLLLSAQFDD